MLKLILKKTRKGLVLFFISLLISNIAFISSVADEDLKPDLKISFVEPPPDSITEGDTLTVKVKIENIGDKNISADDESIEVGLFIDDLYIPVSTNSTKGLSIGKSFIMNLSWTATLGATTNRRLLVEVDYKKNI